MILCLLSISVFAQANNAAYNMETRQLDITQQRAAFGLSEDDYNNIEGSPYANEEFLPGNIYQDNQLVYNNILLRYNIFSDEIEIKNSGDAKEDSFGALVKNPEAFVKILNTIYVFVPLEGSNEKGNYFTVVSEESVFDLYKKTQVSYKAPFKASTSYERDRPGTFEKKNSYFLVSKVGTFYELPSNKSKVIKAMGKKEKEVKAFIKKNKTNLKSEEDIIKLVKHYNSLLETR
jgi:hypothetical protein